MRPIWIVAVFSCCGPPAPVPLSEYQVLRLELGGRVTGLSVRLLTRSDNINSCVLDPSVRVTLNGLPMIAESMGALSTCDPFAPELLGPGCQAQCSDYPRWSAELTPTETGEAVVEIADDSRTITARSPDLLVPRSAALVSPADRTARIGDRLVIASRNLGQLLLEHPAFTGRWEAVMVDGGSSGQLLVWDGGYPVDLFRGDVRLRPDGGSGLLSGIAGAQFSPFKCEGVPDSECTTSFWNRVDVDLGPLTILP